MWFRRLKPALREIANRKPPNGPRAVPPLEPHEAHVVRVERALIVVRWLAVVLAVLLAGYLAQEARQSQLALGDELIRTRHLHRDSLALAEENAELSARLRQ